MSTTTNVNQLKLNVMTQAQYDSATKSPTELYMVTDAEVGQKIQVTTMPTASVNELNNIYQYVGGTNSTYTNGYFYQCVSDGQSTPTYSWARIDVQPGGGGSSLPSQTGHSGEFLKTDGTDPSWAPALVNQGTGTYSIAIGDGVVASSNYSLAVGRKATASGAGSVAIGTPDLYTSWNGPVASGTSAIAIGSGSGRSSSSSASATGSQSIAIGAMTIANKLDSIAFGTNASSTGVASIAIGCEVAASADYSIQLGTSNTSYASTSNSDANTFKVANSNGNFEIMSADGTVPADRLIKSINKYSTIPTAASSNEGWIVQYTGTTDSTYTHGYVYECVSDGASTPTYSWNRIDVQPAGGSLPSQSGNSGKFLSTNGSTLSWKPALINNLGGTSYVGNIYISSNYKAYHNYCVAVGDYADTAGNYATSIGYYATGGYYGIGLGAYAQTSVTGAIQIGKGTNSTAGTMSVGLTTNGSSWNNYRLLDSDGTIPTDRFTTTPSVDGTYVPTLTISSGTATRSWGTGGSSYTAGTNMSISNNTISTSAAQVVIRRFS